MLHPALQVLLALAGMLALPALAFLGIRLLVRHLASEDDPTPDPSR